MISSVRKGINEEEAKEEEGIAQQRGTECVAAISDSANRQASSPFLLLRLLVFICECVCSVRSVTITVYIYIYMRVLLI